MVGSVFKTTSSGAKPMFFNLWNAALPQLKLTEPQHLGQETDTAISTKLTGQWLRERLGILEKEAWVLLGSIRSCWAQNMLSLKGSVSACRQLKIGV